MCPHCDNRPFKTRNPLRLMAHCVGCPHPCPGKPFALLNFTLLSFLLVFVPMALHGVSETVKVMEAHRKNEAEWRAYNDWLCPPMCPLDNPN